MKTKIHEFVIAADVLPTIPSIALQLMEIANDEKAGAGDLAKLLHNDQSLAAEVLKVANSPIYGLSGRVTSIHQAVVLLGFQEVRSISQAMSVFNALFVKSQGAYFNRIKFWEHSLFCAVAARVLAKCYHEDENECFIAGLIHDIGKVIIDRYLQKGFKNVIQRVDNERCTMVSAEAEEIGFTHAEIGEMLLVKWSFPEKIVEAVALHHAPWEANRFQAIPSIIYLANLLCNMNGRPSYVSELVPTREEFLDSHGAEYLRSNGLRIDEEMIQGFEEELNEQFNEASALSA